MTILPRQKRHTMRFNFCKANKAKTSLFVKEKRLHHARQDLGQLCSNNFGHHFRKFHSQCPRLDKCIQAVQVELLHKL